MDLCDRGRRNRLAELREHRLDLGAEGGLDDADRRLTAHRRHPVLQALELEGDLGPDDVGPGRQELPHLDVRGPEPVDRAGKSGQSPDVASGDEIGEGKRQARARAATIVGSTSTNAPSRAKTKPARASLRLWPTAATIGINQSFQPEWIATTPPLSFS